MRNVYVDFEFGESVLVYAHDKLSNDAIKELGEKNVGKVADIYDVSDEMLQFYIIDGRCWYDTKERANKVLAYLHRPLIEED